MASCWSASKMPQSQACWLDRLSQWPPQEEMTQASVAQSWDPASLSKLKSLLLSLWSDHVLLLPIVSYLPCPATVPPLFLCHLQDTLLPPPSHSAVHGTSSEVGSLLSCPSAFQPLQMLLTAGCLSFPSSSLSEPPVSKASLCLVR